MSCAVHLYGLVTHADGQHAFRVEVLDRDENGEAAVLLNEEQKDDAEWLEI